MHVGAIDRTLSALPIAYSANETLVTIGCIMIVLGFLGGVGSTVDGDVEGGCCLTGILFVIGGAILIGIAPPPPPGP